VRTLHNQVLGTGTKNTGGKPNVRTEMKQHTDGQPHRCREESSTLLHGGLDTSRQITSKCQISTGTCFRNDPGEELEACALMAGHQCAAFALLPTVAVRRGTRLLQLTVVAFKTKQVSSVGDPDPYPDSIRIQWGPWIRIRTGFGSGFNGVPGSAPVSGSMRAKMTQET
jgi:hypothetical protein